MQTSLLRKFASLKFRYKCLTAFVVIVLSYIAGYYVLISENRPSVDDYGMPVLPYSSRTSFRRINGNLSIYAPEVDFITTFYKPFYDGKMWITGNSGKNTLTQKEKTPNTHLPPASGYENIKWPGLKEIVSIECSPHGREYAWRKCDASEVPGIYAILKDAHDFVVVPSGDFYHPPPFKYHLKINLQTGSPILLGFCHGYVLFWRDAKMYELPLNQGKRLDELIMSELNK